MTTGWNYFRLHDPGAAFPLYRVVRSDGVELRLGDNVWTTDRSFPASQTGVLREHLLHLLDFNSTGSYTLYFRFDDSTNPSLLDIVDVPTPQSNAVAFVDVVFSEPIDLSAFDFQDITLSLNGGPNLTSGLAVTAVSDTIFRISGHAGVTAISGTYSLAVQAAGVMGMDGSIGAGLRSEQWVMDANGPTIVALEHLATNPRNIVVQTLDVTFSEQIDPATFDYRDITLTRNGGPNLITSAVHLTPFSAVTFRISEFTAVVGNEGTYVLTVNAAAVTDLAGNSGTGTAAETWIMDTTVPAAPTNMVINPDRGISATDGLSNTNTSTLSGNLGESNLTVRIVDTTTGADFGEAAVAGKTFSIPLNLVGAGTHRIRTYATDPAANVSANAFFDLFVDLQPPVLVTTPVAPSPRTNAVASIDIVTSEALNTNTLGLADLFLSRDGGTNLITNSVSIQVVSSNLYRITGLTNLTGTPGNYLLTINAAGIEDRAGNAGVGILSNQWLRLGTNSAPQLAFIPNASIQERDSLTFTAVATDGDNPTNVLTFSLDPGAPAGAAIEPNTGLFTWVPNEQQGPTILPITVRVTDNGLPNLSSSRSFTVSIGEVNEPPVLNTISNRGFSIGATLSFTNKATDADRPTNLLVFTLGSGAPAGALLDSTNGIFRWRPSRAQAGTTNQITIVVTDNGNPPLSDVKTFTVVVSNYLDLFIDSAIVAPGQTGSVPVRIASDLAVTNLSFALGISSGKLTNLALTAASPQVGFVSMTPAGGNSYLLKIGVSSGQVLPKSGSLAQLGFVALSNQNSAFIPLSVSNLTALRPSGSAATNIMPHDGRIVIVGAAALLEASLETNLHRTFVLYGTPGKNYIIESKTNLSSPAWTLIGQETATNQIHRFDIGATNGTIFYRARE